MRGIKTLLRTTPPCYAQTGFLKICPSGGVSDASFRQVAIWVPEARQVELTYRCRPLYYPTARMVPSLVSFYTYQIAEFLIDACSTQGVEALAALVALLANKSCNRFLTERSVRNRFILVSTVYGNLRKITTSRYISLRAIKIALGADAQSKGSRRVTSLKASRNLPLLFEFRNFTGMIFRN